MFMHAITRVDDAWEPGSIAEKKINLKSTKPFAATTSYRRQQRWGVMEFPSWGNVHSWRKWLLAVCSNQLRAASTCISVIPGVVINTLNGNRKTLDLALCPGQFCLGNYLGMTPKVQWVWEQPSPASLHKTLPHELCKIHWGEGCGEKFPLPLLTAWVNQRLLKWLWVTNNNAGQNTLSHLTNLSEN